METAKDVTMDYNSDFFLFVSLENARPMAHGRVQTPAATSPPVLTGVPVSACCYLDRPIPAGYFLFPDLSVRHEGRYKLIFRLYERNKEVQDYDPVDPTTNPESLQDDDLFFTFLNEIRSQPFTVFSAKKFPGLTESTALSRTVAEQGCRVRIRRDVRMRRRETKGSGQGDYEKHEDEYARERRTQSPADAYRQRSASNTSLDRRSSAYEHPHPPPLAPNRSILSFGHPGYNKPYQPPPPAPPSEPVSPATRTPGYRQSFGGPAYPPTPTYSHPYSDMTPTSSSHEDRRSSLPYPPAAPSTYGTPIQPRPPMPAPIRTSFDRSSASEYPPIKIPQSPMKMEPSPTTPMHSAHPSLSLPGLPYSLKRPFDGQEPGRELSPGGTHFLAYKRSSGHTVTKPHSCYEPPATAEIDPRLMDEDINEAEHARKRPYRAYS